MKKKLFKINTIKNKRFLKKISITGASILVIGTITTNISAFLPFFDSKSVKLQDTLVVQKYGNFMEIVKPTYGSGFQTYLKKTTSNIEAYCMENAKPAPDNIRYTRGSKILDKGIKHILLSEPGAGTVRKDYYIKQLALNYYQGEVDWITKVVTKGVEYRDKAVEIAEEAKKIQAGQIQSQYDIHSEIDVTLNSPNMTLINDYYESDWFNVTSTSNLNSYKVILSNAPSGVQVLNSDNKTVTSLSSSDKKFKLRIHKSKVDKTYNNIKVSLQGNFTELQPYSYSPEDTRYQILALMDSVEINSASINMPTATLVAVGDIKIIKSSNRGEKLKDVVFELRKENNLIHTKTTNANGEVEFKDLEKGVYSVIEISAPNGFILNSTPISVTVQDGEEVVVNVPNNVVQGRIAVEKLDSEINTLRLSGAEFTIYDNKNKIVDVITTDSKGYAESKLLDYGVYTMKETSQPIGYHSKSNKIYTINITENNKVYKYTIYNDVFKGKIQIVKIDSNNEENPVEGAGFDIIAENVPGINKGTILEHIITDTDGFAFSKELRYGVYKLKETKTPPGFWQSDRDYFINITQDKKTYVRYIKNDAIQSKIRVIKTDGVNKKLLDGVTFKIVDKTTNTDRIFKEYVGGKVIDKIAFVTNSYGEFVTPQELGIGEYQLVELATKEGYILGTPIDFSINENTSMEDIEGIGVITTLNAVNQRIKGDLIINKVNEYTKEPIEGVEFKVECIEGFSKGSIYTGFTDKSGKLLFEDLEYGKYIVTETKTVPGYVLNDKSITINITENKEIVNIDIANKPIEGYVEVTKVDKETKRELQGTKFEIVDKDNNVVDTITTNESGKAISKKLIYGEYFIRESQPSEGYINNDKVKKVFIDKEKETYKFTFENKRQEGSVEISKINSLTKEFVAEAKLQIKGLDDINKDIKFEFESCNDLTLLKLPVGKYELYEIKSPQFYTLNTMPVEFTVKADETVSVIFENKPVEGYIEINKFDSETNRKLSGAQFEIRDKNRNLKDVVVTDDNGYAKSKKLPFGVYYVIEINSPDGYLINEDVAYKVEVTEEDKIYLVDVSNNRKKGELLFNKKDSSTGKVLDGATIEIKGLDEINKDINIVFESKKEGNNIQIPIGKYEIKETIAPSGYLFNDKVGELEIKENGEIIKAEIKNKKIKKVDTVIGSGSLDKPLTGDSDLITDSGLIILFTGISLLYINKRDR